MELKEFFHMNKGDGELSYAQNSSVQEEAWLMNQNMLESALHSLFLEEDGILDCLNVADFGCGVGPVPKAFVTLVIETMQTRYYKYLKWGIDVQVPKIQIYMNDLPSNDFNLLFKDLLNLEVLKKKDDSKLLCFLMGVPGSYYEELFPHKKLHLVHASYTLHWFSQVPKALCSEQGAPINRGNVYISETSPELVAKAYLAQFEEDFTQFLKCRSQEVISKGRMLLTVRGRPSSSNSLIWQPWELKIFTRALSCLVFQGLIKEEKLDTFNFPYYCASKEELENIVKKQGSFAIECTKTMAHHVAYEIEDKWERSISLAKLIRAFTETLISRHFGEDILDPVYDKLACSAFEYLDHGHFAMHHTVSILLRKH